MKTTITKTNAKKISFLMTRLAVIACSIAMMCSTGLVSLAAEAAPAGADTSAMTTLVNIVFWIIRIIILIPAGIGLIKVVQGQSDENPRDRNAGLITIIVAGACFAVTFIVKSLII